MRFAIVILLFASLACNGPGDPVQPTVINVSNTNINAITNPGGGSGGSASPQPGAILSVDSVIIGVVGGGGSDNATEIRIGTSKFVTCTPKCGSRDCTVAESGAAPTFFGFKGVSSPFADFNVWSDNAYNANIVGRSSGEVAAVCVVKGFSVERAFRVIP